MAYTCTNVFLFSDENGEKTKQHGSSHPDERKVSGGSYKYVMLFLLPFFCASRVIMRFIFHKKKEKGCQKIIVWLTNYQYMCWQINDIF